MNKKKISLILLGVIGINLFSGAHINNVLKLDNVVMAHVLETNETENRGNDINSFNLSTSNLIEDKNLEIEIKKELKKPEDYTLKVEDLYEVIGLDIIGKGVKSLEGIQYCKNIEFLWANDNDIEDMSPLRGLNIQSIGLNRNKITDASGFYYAYVTDQYIEKEAFNSNGSTVIIKNPIKGYNGNLIISNNGKYDAVNDLIIWNNIVSDTNLSIEWGGTGHKFTGKYVQPVKYTKETSTEIISKELTKGKTYRFNFDGIMDNNLIKLEGNNTDLVYCKLLNQNKNSIYFNKAADSYISTVEGSIEITPLDNNVKISIPEHLVESVVEMNESVFFDTIEIAPNQTYLFKGDLKDLDYVKFPTSYVIGTDKLIKKKYETSGNIIETTNIVGENIVFNNGEYFTLTNSGSRSIKFYVPSDLENIISNVNTETEYYQQDLKAGQILTVQSEKLTSIKVLEGAVDFVTFDSSDEVIALEHNYKNDINVLGKVKIYILQDTKLNIPTTIKESCSIEDKEAYIRQEITTGDTVVFNGLKGEYNLDIETEGVTGEYTFNLITKVNSGSSTYEGIQEKTYNSSNSNSISITNGTEINLLGNNNVGGAINILVPVDMQKYMQVKQGTKNISTKKINVNEGVEFTNTSANPIRIDIMMNYVSNINDAQLFMYQKYNEDSSKIECYFGSSRKID